MADTGVDECRFGAIDEPGVIAGAGQRARITGGNEDGTVGLGHSNPLCRGRTRKTLVPGPIETMEDKCEDLRFQASNGLALSSGARVRTPRGSYVRSLGPGTMLNYVKVFTISQSTAGPKA
jgi:hypothetical protein